MASPYPVAQEMLGMSSSARGLQAMNSPVPMGPNRYDSGGASKVEVNTQPYNNERFYEQNIMQNTLSAAPQAASGAMGNVRSQTAASTDAEQKAQNLVTQRMSEALYANQSGTALMRLNSVMQSPEKGKFLNDIAVGKAMAQGLNPDLGQEVAQARQYG
mgnify:CR=1 FL=1